MRTKYKIFTCFLLVFLFSSSLVQASFGISPPYVKNQNLAPGSHFEQKIVLVRGDPTEDWKVSLVVEVPGAESWFSVDRGKEFIMPQGEKQVPIIIKVDVPKNADRKEYQGRIIVKTSPVKASSKGGVSIALGGQIDVKLNVGKEEIYDFKVWSVKLSEAEEGHKLWWLYFPGKIRFGMKIENTGNIKAAPTKVKLDIYDSKQKKLLESLETKKIEKVPSFSTREVEAAFPTRLKPGSYSVRFKIFKEEKIVKEGELHLSIVPLNSIPDYKGYGLAGLDLKDKASLALIAFLIIFALGFGALKLIGLRERQKKKVEVETEEEVSSL